RPSNKTIRAHWATISGIGRHPEKSATFHQQWRMVPRTAAQISAMAVHWSHMRSTCRREKTPENPKAISMLGKVRDWQAWDARNRTNPAARSRFRNPAPEHGSRPDVFHPVKTKMVNYWGLPEDAAARRHHPRESKRCLGRTIHSTGSEIQDACCRESRSANFLCCL